MTQNSMTLIACSLALLIAPAAFAQDSQQSQAKPSKETSKKAGKKAGKKSSEKPTVTAESATLPKLQALTKGTISVHDHLSIMSFTTKLPSFDPNKAPSEMKMDGRLKRTVKTVIDAVKDGQVRQITMTYSHRSEVRNMSMTGMPKPKKKNTKDPLLGRTFVFSFDGKDVTMKSGQYQKKAGDDEDFALKAELHDDQALALARYEFERLNKSFGHAVPRRALKVGETFKADENTVQHLFQLDKADCKKRNMTFKGTALCGKTKCAVFSLDITIAQQSKAAQMSGKKSALFFEIKGTAYINLKTGRVIELDLGGEAVEEGPQGKIDDRIKASISAYEIYSFPPKK